MIKAKLLFLLGIVVLLYSSCSDVYSPALYHQDVAYQPKPTSFDTVKDANYISAGYNTYNGANFTGQLQSGQLNLSRGHVFNNFNLAYGAFGVAGTYSSTSSDQSKSNFSKFFGAYGGRVSANMFTTSDNVDFRYIGFEAIYSHEFGDYADFRQAYYSAGNSFVDARTNLLTAGLTTEVIFHSRRKKYIQHGIRGFLGTTFGYNNLDAVYYKNENSAARVYRNYFPKASYFINVKNYFGTAEIDDTSFLFRFGLKF